MSRCDERARHLEKLQRDPSDSRHGTATGYTYGCRCPRCVQAFSRYRQANPEKTGKPGAFFERATKERLDVLLASAAKDQATIHIPGTGPVAIELPGWERGDDDQLRAG